MPAWTTTVRARRLPSALRLARRLTAHQIETLMRQSEEAINGGEISERQSIQLVKRLREVESTSGPAHAFAGSEADGAEYLTKIDLCT